MSWLEDFFRQEQSFDLRIMELGDEFFTSKKLKRIDDNCIVEVFESCSRSIGHEYAVSLF